ncbi:hypothetical protein [Conexibacter woesei]|uniref:Uncharacterized protein n=1 Tax=Conexibacter woesei (strain DSM 14684 / CCUG 47730 / CIP 108061 / JCM 11494 / NBRC 100937 / ID131577) TaxID=469383 RepID=D3FC98_CONWI|nr:hypothetical protein [Conexibacter woesei]ADB53393.1 hypothetical protein Cwoe_4982 [Conexibacter woesei DSM 14684]
MRIPTLLPLLVLAALVGAAAPAGAATPQQIIRDCSGSPTGLLRGTYTQAELRAALNRAHGEVAEYTGCPDAIRAKMRELARESARGGEGSGGGGTGDGGGGGPAGGGSGAGAAGGDGAGGGPAGDGGAGGGGAGGTGGDETTADSGPASPPPHQAGSSVPVQLAGGPVVPGLGGVETDGTQALPLPLLAFFALLLATAAGVGAASAGRLLRVRGRA